MEPIRSVVQNGFIESAKRFLSPKVIGIAVLAVATLVTLGLVLYRYYQKHHTLANSDRAFTPNNAPSLTQLPGQTDDLPNPPAPTSGSVSPRVIPFTTNDIPPREVHEFMQNLGGHVEATSLRLKKLESGEWEISTPDQKVLYRIKPLVEIVADLRGSSSHHRDAFTLIPEELKGKATNPNTIPFSHNLNLSMAVERAFGYEYDATTGIMRTYSAIDGDDEHPGSEWVKMVEYQQEYVGDPRATVRVITPVGSSGRREQFVRMDEIVSFAPRQFNFLMIPETVMAYARNFGPGTIIAPIQHIRDHREDFISGRPLPVEGWVVQNDQKDIYEQVDPTVVITMGEPVEGWVVDSHIAPEALAFQVRD